MNHKHPAEERKPLRNRVRKIGGQLTAIEKMLEEDRDCPEILNQVISARKGLKSFAEILIHQHARFCIEAATQEVGKKKLRELIQLLERYVE